MRTNGTDRRRLPGCGAPEFSPDGKRIAFAGAPSYLSSSDRGIWVMNRDGSHLRRLVKADDDGASEVYQPDFSPDGSHIVYSRCMPESPPHDCGYQAVVMRSGGGFKHVISRDQQPQRPIFSPDGTRIAMSRGIPCSSEAYGGRIITIALNGTHPQVVTQPDVEECHEESSDLEPNWQPIPPSW
jgi:dipeptidyl aminopeptidase/acylaminoacyl peptidase